MVPAPRFRGRVGAPDRVSADARGSAGEARGPSRRGVHASSRERGGRRFAPYTDDTQLAEAVLRGALWSRATGRPRDATMGHLAKRFVVWAFVPQGGHRAPGNATLAGCRLLAEGIPWREAGGADAGGCGSVMRAYPFGLVFGDDLAETERWAVEHSRLTHNAPIALAACAAMAVGAALVVRREPVDAVLGGMVEASARWDAGTAAMIEGAWMRVRAAWRRR